MTVRVKSLFPARVVQYTECIAGPTPAQNRIEVTERRIEEWIYHSIACLMTSRSEIALR
jgi:hypothetical protein